MSENKEFDFKVEGGEIVTTVDTNKNGKPSVKLVIDINEVIAEAIAKIAS